MKIRPLGTKLFHADGQTDKYDEANTRFSQFCEKRLPTAMIQLKNIRGHRTKFSRPGL